MAEGNTERSFRDKWVNNETVALNATLQEGSDIFNWILTRSGFSGSADLATFLSEKGRILDAGCGNGRVTALLQRYARSNSEIVGIDLTSFEIAKKNLSHLPNVRFFEANLMDDLSRFGQFDFIYCQEVLHHTQDPQRSFKNICQLLAPGGEVAIYVYKKKAPAREFVDDFVREKIGPMPYEKAMEVCNQITELGKALSEQSVQIRVPQVDVLDIKAGEYPLQRFIYHFFMKCFWNPELNFSENACINYDWYHPQLCSKHTPEEIRGWFQQEGLEIIHEYVDFYGIAVRGKRV